MKKFLTFTIAMAFAIIAYGQIPTVFFDPKTSCFDGCLPLPAQSTFVITGNVSENISRVNVEIFKTNRLTKPVYFSSWQRSYREQGTLFHAPVNQMLRSNDEYSFRFRYYVPLPAEEHQQVVQMLDVAITHYIKAQTRVRRGKLVFDKTPEVMLNELAVIVNNGFRNFDLDEFQFSDIVKEKINQIEALGLSANAEDINTAKALAELKDLVVFEVKAFMPAKINTVFQEVIINDYTTQKLANVVGINLGYGATFIQSNNMGYAPYAGVSFPLGNMAFAPFMSRMSLSAGLFLTDIKGEDNLTYTGPVIKKPVYLGLGYRVYDFIRFNAGMVVLEKNKTTIDNISLRDVDFRPFVGISIDLNLWIGLGNQRP